MTARKEIRSSPASASKTSIGEATRRHTGQKYSTAQGVEVNGTQPIGRVFSKKQEGGGGTHVETKPKAGRSRGSGRPKFL